MRANDMAGESEKMADRPIKASGLTGDVLSDPHRIRRHGKVSARKEGATVAQSLRSRRRRRLAEQLVSNSRQLTKIPHRRPPPWADDANCSRTDAAPGPNEANK